MTEQTTIIPDAPKRKRVITDPAKSVWVARAVKAEGALHDMGIALDKATANAESLRQSLAFEVRWHRSYVRYSTLAAIAAFVAGVVAGKAVFG